LPVESLRYPRRMTIETPRKRTWVGEWVRSESFWRDVVSRALAGLIVLLVGTAVAAVLGIIPWSTAGGAITLVLVVLVAVVALTLIATALLKPPGYRGPTWKLWLPVGAVLLVFTVILCVGGYLLGAIGYDPSP